jgi:hypothetical protein
VVVRSTGTTSFGTSVGLEVELTEPSLFFGHGDRAVQRFAAALEARVRC